MKVAPFRYHAPQTIDEAVTLLAEVAPLDGRILAGGQSLVPIMAFRLSRPAHLVDINGVEALRRLAIDGDRLGIGACVRHSAFHRPAVEGPLGELLSTVVRHIAHYPIRARGTFCGSIAHADPASEWCTVAAALGAEMVAQSVRGTRVIPAHEFFAGIMTTTLEDDELLTEVRLPLLPPDARFGFYEFNRRAGDFALAMALAVYRVEDGRIVEPRLAVGGAETHARRIAEAEQVLAGPGAGGRQLCRRCRAGGRGDRSDGRRANQRGISPRPRTYGYAPRIGAVAAVIDETQPSPTAQTAAMTEKFEFQLHINGHDHSVRVEPRKTLADVIRDECGLTGTHIGCEHGVCGACTVILDNDAVRSCLMFAVQAKGKRIRTVEGLADGDKLHPMQEAFIAHHALQCGFCTPGFLMLAVNALETNPELSDEEILEVLSSNLCRCTGYQNIVKAVRIRAADMRRTPAR